MPKLTLQLQLLPDAEQAVALRTTVERFNAAANWPAGPAFAARTAGKYELQRRHYRVLRERFGLPADMAVRCVARVSESYKRDRAKRPAFREHAAVPYSHGKNYGFKGVGRVSLSTLRGRVVVAFLIGQYQRERFGLAKALGWSEELKLIAGLESDPEPRHKPERHSHEEVSAPAPGGSGLSPPGEGHSGAAAGTPSFPACRCPACGHEFAAPVPAEMGESSAPR
jgi:hypothetical protein